MSILSGNIRGTSSEVPLRVAFLNWRDSTHPEGGGAELYAQTVCAGLARRGHAVTLYCADHGAAPRDEQHDGYLIRRRGDRLSVYAAALRQLRSDARADGPFDVVVDTQNGVPFFTPLQTRTPSVVLVHHVHREQWPVVFGPVQSRVGWFVESRVAPVVNRGRQYVAVSERTKEELTWLGVGAKRIRVIHNGTRAPLESGAGRADRPTLLVLGRLVPHKRIEHAVDVVAALRTTHPTLRLRILGEGWWREEIRQHARARGVLDQVDLLGFVSESVKARELDRAWLALAPSVKEGWGLSVVEAASHGVPTIAYHGAGGLSESIVDGVTGVLVHTREELVGATRNLIDDAVRRESLSGSARELSSRYTWTACVDDWEALLGDVSRASRRS
jgi:glycosyltransferase involved in cell wall biosynthesis